jgi:predicted Fe-S protein YdhL (DUF1289 family)
MKNFLAVLSLTTMAFASTCAFSLDYSDNDTPPQTAAETAALKAERLAAQQKWSSLTPAEKAAVKSSARQKRWADLTAIEMVSDNDTEMLTPDQSAQLKSERAAARARWAAMSPQEKAAMRKSVREKRLSEMTELEKVAGSGS